MVLFVVACAVRLYDLTGQSLWYDEGSSLALTDSRSAVAALHAVLVTRGSEFLMPLYFWLLAAWRSIAGDGESALRLLSVMLAAPSVLILSCAAARIAGPRTAAWTAAAAGLSAYGVYYSQEIRPYALALTLTSLLLFAYGECRMGEDAIARRWRPVLWVGSALLVWTHALGALFLAAMALADLAVHRDWRPALRLWGPAALAAGSFAVWLVLHLRLTAGGGASVPGSEVNLALRAGFLTLGTFVGTTFGPPVEALRGGDRLSVLTEALPMFLLAGVALVVVAWSFVAALRRARRGPWLAAEPTRVWLSLTVALVLLLVFLLGFSVLADFNLNPRHAFAVWALLFLLMPVWLVGLVPPEQAGVRGIGVIGLLGVIGLNLYSLANYFWAPRHARDDYRAAAQYAAAHPGATAVLLFGQARALEYYAGRRVLDGNAWTADLGAQLARRLQRPGELILIVNRGFHWREDRAAYIKAAVGPAYALKEVARPVYFEIYRFQRTGS